MKGFRPHPDGYVARFEELEAKVLADVVAQVVGLLTDDDDLGPVAGHGSFELGPVPTPEDPAVHRLLPDASRDDAEIAEEFRRLTQEDLRRVKVARARDVVAAFGELGPRGRLVVPRERAVAVAGAFADVRLVLADRLGLVTDDDAVELDRFVQGPEPAGAGEAARFQLASVYAGFSYLQETLVQAMMADLDQ